MTAVRQFVEEYFAFCETRERANAGTAAKWATTARRVRERENADSKGDATGTTNEHAQIIARGGEPGVPHRTARGTRACVIIVKKQFPWV
jgi:hypothetical protein